MQKNEFSQDETHKNILRDQFLRSFSQPFRFRTEWEKVKRLVKGKRP